VLVRVNNLMPNAVQLWCTTYVVMSSAGQADKEGYESGAEDSDLDLGREQEEQGADSDEVCLFFSHHYC
jgi:hypothetical protein